MPARPPRIVVVDVVVVVVVVLTDVDASAERANDAIVYPLPRSSTPRALASSSFSDVVVVLCRRPSSFARSRTPGPRADDVDRSVVRSIGRSVGQILVVVVVVRAVRTVVLILHNGPFILTHTHTPLPPRARVRPSVRCRRTHDASCLSGATIASLLRPGRYFDLIVVVVLCRRRHPSSRRGRGLRGRRETKNGASRARRPIRSFVRFVRPIRSFAAPTIVGWRIGGLEDWRIAPSRRRVPCSVFRVRARDRRVNVPSGGRG